MKSFGFAADLISATRDSESNGEPQAGPFNKIFGRSRLARNWGVLGLVAALALLSGSQAATAQTNRLNTGLVGQSGSTVIPVLNGEDDWNVTADPVLGGVPRLAWVIPPTGGHLTWPAPLPNSQWISGAGNRYNGSMPPPRTRFIYQTCFTIGTLFSAPMLTMQLRGDDIIRRVKLNGTTIFDDLDMNAKASPTKAGSHLGPLLSINWTAAGDFHFGQNCLEVMVEDVDGLVSGLNVVATVTYQPVVLGTGGTIGTVTQGCLSTGQIIQTDLSTGTTNGVKNPAGQMDPNWNLIGVPAGTGTAGPAFSTNSFSNWVLNLPQSANWIQRIQNLNPQADAPGPYTYRVQFSPNINLFSSIQLIVRYAADNSAVVLLNNNQVAFCAGPNCFSSWQPTLTLPITASLNNLDIVVTNNASGLANPNNATGLMADAKLRATCK
jgi:hypothetical protein